MILSHDFNNFFSLNKTRTHLTPTFFSSAYLHHRHISLSIPHSPNLNNSPLITKTPNSFNFSSFLTKCSRTQISSIDTSRSLESKLTNEAKTQDKSFWGAVTLIIGTAVGPGMLGLPSATIKSGPLPSTIAIILSWVYVISSILLVAELSFAEMEENGVGEVSFTGLAKTALGGWMGILVAIIYACLSFSLLIACVSGIGSIINQWFPLMNPVIAHVLFPCFTGILIGFFPFKAIDGTNRLLCLLMLFSITALIATGLSIGRTHILSSFGYASWGLSAILPAIPVTVLTLGFHVITPFVCKIVGNSVFDARNAVLFGGSVPLVMVLTWNLVVLGLSQTKKASSQDPIALLLSVSSSALPAVQGFAFAALSTSLIGYAVSFPKQLVDTFELIWKETNFKSLKCSSIGSSYEKNRTGKVGFTVYSKEGRNRGSPGEISFIGSRSSSSDLGDNIQVSSSEGFGSVNIFVMLVVLGVPTVIASFFPSAFSKSLDFAGVYANCFLFGILPPIMAWIHRSRRKTRSSTDVHLLPGGNTVLLLLFAIALILGIWH